MSTLVIVNPYAAGGTALKAWHSVEQQAHELLGAFSVAVTDSTGHIQPALSDAFALGARRIISVGGDGTNNAVINALVDIADSVGLPDKLTYGTIPIGTGMDWARATGIPIEPVAALHWIVRAQPRATDIGVLQFTAPDGATVRRYFLNIASFGLSGEVDRRVSDKPRRPWTFLMQTVLALLSYDPPSVRVQLDGVEFFSGRALLVACANGTTFGRGMKIAPDASPYDGSLDIVLVKQAGKITVLRALDRVYKGTHLTHPAVVSGRATQVRLLTNDVPIDLDIDGEYTRGIDPLVMLRPGFLPLLVG